MTLKPLSITTAKRLNKQLKSQKKRKGRLVKTPKNPEVRYRKQLDELTQRLRKDIRTDILPLLYKLQPEYTSDEYASDLEEAFDKLRKSYNKINKEAKKIARDFAKNTEKTNKRRFYSAVEETMGVNLKTIIQNERLDDILIATTRENVALIRSIPEEYFKKIETIVFSGTTQKKPAKSMIKQITELGHSTTKRAKLIARDQTSKLNAALSQQRQQNLGVEEYVWRTAGDDRVRDSHISKNGKIFRWDDPPSDTGHPGHDIQCRCVAQAIVKI